MPKYEIVSKSKIIEFPGNVDWAEVKGYADFLDVSEPEEGKHTIREVE